MFGTSGINTEEQVGKYLTYGINHCKIVSMSVIKAQSTESKKVQFNMEGMPVGKDFQGVEGAKGKVCRVETSYMKEDKAYKDFMRQIGVIADKLGVRKEVDAVKASSIEDFIAQIEPILKGKFAWWMFGGEEYNEKKWKQSLLKFGFIKAESEVDEATLKMDGYIGVEIRNKENVVAMKFNKENKFHYNPFVKSADADILPGASDSMKDMNFSLPGSTSSVDDLPFGEISNDTSDLPFGND